MRQCIPFLVLLAGCLPKATPAPPTVMTYAGVERPADRVRIDVAEASRRYASAIEVSTQAIQDSTRDPAVWHAAQVWKINATQAAQDAAFRFDPLVSFLDLYALSEQQRNYLTTGNGKTLFGELQPVALDAVSESQRELRDYLDGIVAPGKQHYLDSVLAWADRHPLEQGGIARPSLESVSARLIDGDETSIFSAVGDLQQTARSLNGRMALLQQNVGKQIRWEVELMASQLLPPSSRDTLLGGVAAIASAADRLARLGEGLPGMVDEQRIATFAGVAAEREALFAGLESERKIVLDHVTAERIAVMASIDEQRKATLKDVEAISTRITAHAMQQVTELADHLVLRVALFIVLPMLLGIGLLIIALAFILRRREPDAGSREPVVSAR